MFGIVRRTHGSDTLKSAESPLNLLRYVLFKRGMLASGGVEGFAFTQVRPGPVAAPDLEIMFLPFERRNEFLEPPREHAFTIASAVVAPRSRGRLSLRSPDPLVPPGIDASVACEGIRLSRRIASTPPLAAHNAGEARPGASIESDRDLLAYASTDMQTVYHPTSTCRMECCASNRTGRKLGSHEVGGTSREDRPIGLRDKAMKTLPAVVRAEYRGDFRIRLVFNDGVEGTIDFSEWLSGPVFQPLKDRGYFARFFVEGGTVTWPNGADIAPETLHERVRANAAA